MYLKNVSIDAKINLSGHLYDIEDFLKINKDHPDIKDLLKNVGAQSILIVKAISDYEYCHQDKDKLIDEIKQLVEYDKHKGSV